MPKREAPKGLSGESQKAIEARKANLLNEALPQKNPNPEKVLEKKADEGYHSLAGPNNKGWC